MGTITGFIGHRLARYLAQSSHDHSAAPATDPQLLLACVKIADVILVEGNSRFAKAIKYLTQSTWSHAALYVGMQVLRPGAAPEPCFVEADVIEGVRKVGISEFVGYHVRLCRAVGLDDNERASVASFALNRLGSQYDLRNVIDLARYLLPTPPVPSRLRRRMITLGSGDPTKATCSTLIAEAFQAVQQPILPVVTKTISHAPDCPGCISEILSIRDHFMFVPRDFDVSPYFDLIKPSLAGGPAIAIAARRDMMMTASIGYHGSA